MFKIILLTIAVFALAGCDSVNKTSTSTSTMVVETKRKPEFHAQCAVGNLVVDEIVTEINPFGSRVSYYNKEGKQVVFASNCKFTEI